MAAQVQTPFNDGHLLYDELHQMYPEVAENDIMRLMTEVRDRHSSIMLLNDQSD